jgi:hypothetical protein
MAELYPFSNRTVELLSKPPTAGGTHRWLAQAASGVCRVLTAEACAAFLRECCELFVTHRQVPEREIAAAVELAYGRGTGGGGRGTGIGSRANYGRGALTWPEAEPGVIGDVTAYAIPLFDGVTETGHTAADVLPKLFRPGEPVCTGACSERALVRPVEAVVADAERMQFICVNPMRGAEALNKVGKLSARCQNNVAVRRYLVAEFDDPGLTKLQQAQLASALAELVPLVMAVDSGGKSVHAWYRVEGMARQDQARFFAMACALGADSTRWDICGWLRMPGGLRMKADGSRVRQKILYWSPVNE